MARALYIHWPFCLAKCPYCDFNSHVRASVDLPQWRAGLLRELEYEAELAGNAPLDSIFFGGGTPSLMPPGLVADLIEAAERHWGFAVGIEITLEGNPTSIESARYADLAAAGVNRVSLGVQALDDSALKRLGREHDVEEALCALDIAQSLFSRVSFDLIYARPGQTKQAWQSELTQALSFGTDHLSLYQLTIEPSTRFATLVREGALTPLDDECAASLFALTQAMTRDAGLPAYEISNHARPGQESRHNLAYWRYQDYCGIGPGAHGRRGGMATERHRKPENWLRQVHERGHGIALERFLQPAEMATEALMMGLRLREGIDLAALSTRTAIPTSQLCDPDKLNFYCQQGLCWQQGERIGATANGLALLDGLLGELVPAELVAG